MENNLMQKLIIAVCSELSSDNDEDIIITEKEMENTYKKIIDKLAHNIFFAAVGNELLLEAFEKLSRLERIIVVFNIMLDYSSADIAMLAGSTPDSIYSQKSKALKKLRESMTS